MEQKPDKSDDLLHKLIHVSLFSYLMLLPFPHVTTLREVAFWSAVVFWIIFRYKKPEPFMPLKDPIFLSLSFFMLITFTASILGIEPLDNIMRFKGELLKPFLLFLIAFTAYNSIEKIKKLLLAPVFAFTIYTILVVFESLDWGLSYYWDLNLRDNFTWLSGYTAKSTALFPLTFGYLFITKKNIYRFLLLIILLIEFGIIVTYREVTATCSTLLIIMFAALFVQPKYYRQLLRVSIAMIITFAIIILFNFKDNPAVAEYKNKIYMITHPVEEINKPTALSMRFPMWKAAFDVINERPFLGYGWGMKKYTNIATNKIFMNKWKTTNTEVHEMYLSLINRGTFISPHNMIIELAIQSGLLGVISFIVFIGIYLYQLFKNLLLSNSVLDHNFSIILVFGVLLSFITTNLMDDDIWKTSWKVLFLVLGAGAYWVRNANEHDS
jgi:O-antigen ligase